MYELQPIAPQQPPTRRQSGNRFWRGFVSGMLAFVACAAAVSALLLLGYGVIARDLPSPSELRQRASSFQTTRIFDRAGNLLNETFDPNMGRRTEVRLDEISPALVQATIATEDVQLLSPPRHRPRGAGARPVLRRAGEGRRGRRLHHHATTGQAGHAHSGTDRHPEGEGGDPGGRNHAPVQQR